MRGGWALCHSRTDRWGIMGNMPEIIKDSPGHNERLWIGERKTPRKASFSWLFKKKLLLSEWFALRSWSLYLHVWGSWRAPAKIFGLVVKQNRVLFVFDLRKWHLYEVASQTDSPPWHIHQWQSKGASFQTLPACLALYQHPFMSHLVNVSEARQPCFTVWTCLRFPFSKIFKVQGVKNNIF